MIFDLFPTAVGHYNIGRSLTKEELDFLKNLPKVSNVGNLTSKSADLSNAEELASIKSFIEEKLNDYFRAVYVPKHDVNLKMTQCWGNYTEPGGHHHRHSHPNSFISGVFYAQTEPQRDKIHFWKDRYEQVLVTPSEYNRWNSESWYYSTAPGDLILFPSWQTHFVEAISEGPTRISLAFNTFPEGNLGDHMDLTHAKVVFTNAAT
jgi:uncharacterized protein (TIGR02466 family)